MSLNPVVVAVTPRIVERSRPTREACLALKAEARDSGVGLRDGDVVRVCAATGTLAAMVAEETLAARAAAPPPPPPRGTGRELFAFMRYGADEAEKGASAMLAAMAGVA